MRERGVQVVTVRELGQLGDTDENHLRRATEMGYVLCTHDRDYLRLSASGVSHAGIVFFASRYPSVGDWVRGLELICQVMTAADMMNHIEFLPQ